MPADEAAAQAAGGALTIVDVRTPGEWRSTGIPQGAVQVPLNHPGGIEAFLEEVSEAVDGDKERPIAFICAAGGRSSAAQKLAREAGFTAVADIDEGMLGSSGGPGWIARGLPTEACGC
ncbi:MAG: rhodanese-like domain-containing protein [Rhodovibrionaceae bacterium]